MILAAINHLAWRYVGLECAAQNLCSVISRVFSCSKGHAAEGHRQSQPVFDRTHLAILALLLPLLDDVLTGATRQALHHAVLAVHAWVNERDHGAQARHGLACTSYVCALFLRLEGAVLQLPFSPVTGVR